MLLELLSHMAVVVTEAGASSDILKAEQLAIHYWFTSGYCQNSLHKAPAPNYEVLDLV